MTLRRRRLLSLAGVAVLAGCSTGPRGPAPSAAPPPLSVRQRDRNVIALFALSLLDTRYAWGGRGPATGFDASALVSHAVEQAAGLRLRGNAAELGRQSRPIDPERLRAGDLVFFNTLG
ncbi:MAG: C40 family peptidase, partial [Limnohabitans sp.]